MKAQSWISCFVVVCGFATPAAALPNITVNGDFESPSAPGYLSYTAPNSFQGWTVATGGVDLVANTFYAPASGLQSLDLNSVTSGSIFQNITTSLGQPYLITFSFAANPLPDNPSFPAPAIKKMEARWNNTILGTFTRDTTRATASNVGWTDYSVGVVGTGADRLTFTSLTIGSAGPAIDNVRVSAIPEPTSSLLSAITALTFLFSRHTRSQSQ